MLLCVKYLTFMLQNIFYYPCCINQLDVYCYIYHKIPFLCHDCLLSSFPTSSSPSFLPSSLFLWITILQPDCILPSLKENSMLLIFFHIVSVISFGLFYPSQSFELLTFLHIHVSLHCLSLKSFQQVLHVARIISSLSGPNMSFVL